MRNAYAGITAATPDRTQAIVDIAMAQGHKPYATPEYQREGALRSFKVELMSFPCWQDSKSRVGVYARIVPGDPTTAVWVNANLID